MLQAIFWGVSDGVERQFGTVTATPNGLDIAGPRAARLKEIVAEDRQPGMTDADLIEFFAEKYSGSYFYVQLSEANDQ
jgi:hypothetical protein